MRLDAPFILRELRRLQSREADVFGAELHQFRLNDPSPESAVAAFERKHSIHLPADYRNFLTMIGNGGAGPFYGIFPLGLRDGLGETIEPWQEEDGFIGKLSEPFRHEDAWNDLTGRPLDELVHEDETEYWKQQEEFDNRYYAGSLMNGAIPICHEGCAQRIWLVVAGDQAGRLWRDTRSEDTGIAPLLLSNGSIANFATWYLEWLTRSLEASSG